MSAGEWATIVGHLTILVATLATLMSQWLREGRQHRWQEHQRRKLDQMHKDIKNGHQTSENYEGKDGC